MENTIDRPNLVDDCLPAFSMLYYAPGLGCCNIGMPVNTTALSVQERALNPSQPNVLKLVRLSAPTQLHRHGSRREILSGSL